VPKDSGRQSRNRIVVQTASRRYAQTPKSQPGPWTREGLLALSVIGAAALATFLALFLTSRPFDPMNSTVLPQASIPQGPPMVTPSPKPSVSGTPQQKPSSEQSPAPPEETAVVNNPDDAGIQAQIERTLAADPALAKLDVSTLVDQGRVTIVGSVRSGDLKSRVERAISQIKGVTSVDNQLVVTEATP
jgi:BON domain-containing protein